MSGATLERQSHGQTKKAITDQEPAMNPDYLNAEMQYNHERIRAMFADANARRGRSPARPRISLVRRCGAATSRSTH